ncbi:MAG: hypothetical protein L0Y80_02295 [Ignavibacteriae bacterium]|nr:hypothetical protein [Ignavibacteriota bacterium]
MAFLEKAKQFFKTYWTAILAWVIIIVGVEIGLYYGFDEGILTMIALIVGFLGQAFAALIAWIGLVPLIGPLAAKVLSLPFIWLLNGIGYLVTIVAIKRGYPKEVLNYRVLTITLLVGITIGYILGKVI